MRARYQPWSPNTSWNHLLLTRRLIHPTIQSRCVTCQDTRMLQKQTELFLGCVLGQLSMSASTNCGQKKILHPSFDSGHNARNSLLLFKPLPLLSSLCAEVRSSVQVSLVGTFTYQEQCLSGAMRASEENVRPRLSIWSSNSTPREICPYKNVDANVPSSIIHHS